MLTKSLGRLAPLSQRNPTPKVALTFCRHNSGMPPTYSSRGAGMSRDEMQEQKWKNEKLAEERAKSLDKNQTRTWRAGDVYSPHDLSPSEMRKWRKRKSPSRDVFDVLSINPLHQYKNFAMMSEYMTEMGRIKPRSQTGLRPVNQRKISKAIRRAVALGLMPSVHKHPEVLIAKGEI